MDIQGIIFDLDGVIVSTDEFHYQAWQQLADEEGIPFDRTINHRLRGVSRMESLAIMLEKAPRSYSQAEREEMAEKKNGTYRELLGQLSRNDVLSGVEPILEQLRSRGIRMAIASSSKNARYILEQIEMTDAFDAIVDGTDIANSKPHPEVFQKAGEALGLPPGACLVVEDADAGVEAAKAAGMACLAVGAAAKNPKADIASDALGSCGVELLLNVS